MTGAQPAVNRKGRIPRATRRTGYAISIGINVVLIWVLVNLVEWDILPFLTEDFEQLIPITVFSIVVGIVLNLVYLFFDPPWLRILGDTVNSAIAFLVILRTYQVFPFEFDTGFWSGATRAILIIIGVATALATLFNVGKLAGGRVHEVDLGNRGA